MRFFFFDLDPMKHTVTQRDEETLHKLLLTVPHRLDVTVKDIPEHEWKGVIRPQIVRAAHESGDTWAEREACRLVAEHVVTHDANYTTGQVDRCIAYLKTIEVQKQ